MFQKGSMNWCKSFMVFSALFYFFSLLLVPQGCLLGSSKSVCLHLNSSSWSPDISVFSVYFSDCRKGVSYLSLNPWTILDSFCFFTPLYRSNDIFFLFCKYITLIIHPLIPSFINYLFIRKVDMVSNNCHKL